MGATPWRFKSSPGHHSIVSIVFSVVSAVFSAVVFDGPLAREGQASDTAFCHRKACITDFFVTTLGVCSGLPAQALRGLGDVPISFVNL